MKSVSPAAESLVFVFGTLKTGFPNAASNRGRRLPGHFRTLESWPLYLVGERHSPWLVLSRGKGMPVRGQVYAVDAESLLRMDRLERIGLEDGYRRVEIRVIAEANGREYDVFVYAKLPQQLMSVEIREGPFDEYRPEHAALYRPRGS